jgi:hypothetical protein
MTNHQRVSIGSSAAEGGDTSRDPQRTQLRPLGYNPIGRTDIRRGARNSINCVRAINGARGLILLA